MTLKNQVKNVYGVGLNNVGSYQTSGKPFVTASTVTDGTEKHIEFPEVSNNITVKLDSASGGVAPTGLSFVGEDFYYINDTQVPVANNTSRSFTIWVNVKKQFFTTNNIVLIRGKLGDVRRFGIRTFASSWLFQMREVASSIRHPVSPGWQMLAFSFSGTDLTCRGYYNGEKIGEASATSFAGANIGGGMVLGPSFAHGLGTDCDYEVRDAILWDNELSDAQIQNLYNSFMDYTDSAYTDAGLPNKLIWVKPEESVGSSSTTLINSGDFSNYGNLTLTNNGAGDTASFISSKNLSLVNKKGYTIDQNFQLISNFTTLPTETYIILHKSAEVSNIDHYLLTAGGLKLQIQYNPSLRRYRFFIRNSDDTGYLSQIFFQDLRFEPHHLTVTINTTQEIKVYLNSVLKGTLDCSSTNALSGISPIRLGTSAGFDQDYGFIELARFSVALTQEEVTEAFNEGLYLDLRNHSQANNLRNYWLFGDGVGDSFTNGGGSGVVVNVVDQMGNDPDFTDDGTTSGETITEFNQPVLSGSSAGSGGELRVHYRPKGYNNVTTGKHYWTLDSQNESITMNVKSKELYLSADGGDCDYSVEAELTNIPSSRMFQHTGSGVDE